jgi:hypothetical protein
MNYGNITKASFTADIRKKQAFFNRCKRRFKVATTAGEKQFLKSEANRICNELKTCCKTWKSCGFGIKTNWIVKGFTPTNFKSITGARPNWRKNTRSSARKTSVRGYGRRTNSTRSKSYGSNRTRTSARRMTYVAW